MAIIAIPDARETPRAIPGLSAGCPGEHRHGRVDHCAVEDVRRAQDPDLEREGERAARVGELREEGEEQHQRLRVEAACPGAG